ncbi:hypothetical protein NDU88_001604 [Pleurodeles waltl]|uniref:G-protein coupled receptors family 1 profile domain-containing protein n=1 Tax=Pleurodeles waltl TaxID=8319 RepID=A0AAV7S8H6_PLEWA|nr:hypothetical protein NDU88_001604 [Pleurodeles waltl]
MAHCYYNETIPFFYNNSGKILNTNWTNKDRLVIGLGLTVCLFALLTNFLVITAIVINRRFHYPIYYLLANLAAADLFAGVGYTFLMFHTGPRTSQLSIKTWFLRQTLIDTSLTASVANLLAIAVERHQTVFTMQLHSTMSNRRVTILIVFIWIAAILLGLIPSFGWSCLCNIKKCSRMAPLYSRDYLVFWAISNLVVFLIMVVAYSHISIYVKRKALRMSQHTSCHPKYKENMISLMKTVVIILKLEGMLQIWLGELDARLQIWLGELDARLQIWLGELDARLQIWLGELDARLQIWLGELDARLQIWLGELDTRLQRGLGELDTRLQRGLGELDAMFQRRFGELDRKIQRLIGELDTMFQMWLRELDPMLQRWVGELNAILKRWHGEMEAMLQELFGELDTVLHGWLGERDAILPEVAWRAGRHPPRGGLESGTPSSQRWLGERDAILPEVAWRAGRHPPRGGLESGTPSSQRWLGELNAILPEVAWRAERHPPRGGLES